MPRKTLDPALDSLYTCPDGMAHAWVYQGKRTQVYFCSRCGVSVSKVIMRTEEEHGDIR